MRQSLRRQTVPTRKAYMKEVYQQQYRLYTSSFDSFPGYPLFDQRISMRERDVLCIWSVTIAYHIILPVDIKASACWIIHVDNICFVREARAYQGSFESSNLASGTRDWYLPQIPFSAAFLAFDIRAANSNEAPILRGKAVPLYA